MPCFLNINKNKKIRILSAVFINGTLRIKSHYRPPRIIDRALTLRMLSKNISGQHSEIFVLFFRENRLYISGHELSKSISQEKYNQFVVSQICSQSSCSKG